jgi:hypothetical protein
MQTLITLKQEVLSSGIERRIKLKVNGLFEGTFLFHLQDGIDVLATYFTSVTFLAYSTLKI